MTVSTSVGLSKLVCWFSPFFSMRSKYLWLLLLLESDICICSTYKDMHVGCKSLICFNVVHAWFKLNSINQSLCFHSRNIFNFVGCCTIFYQACNSCNAPYVFKVFLVSVFENELYYQTRFQTSARIFLHLLVILSAASPVPFFSFCCFFFNWSCLHSCAVWLILCLFTSVLAF